MPQKRGSEERNRNQKSLRQIIKLPQSINVPFDLMVEILSRLPVKTLASYSIYGYVRGLIYYFTNSNLYAIYNPTTRQNVLLPLSKENKALDDELSSLDPAGKCGLSIKYWRKIEIQVDIPPPRSNGRFDVRFERFDHIQMPIDVAMNQLEELSLVNYQGKLGCTFYSKDRAEVWVMKDHGSEKHEWSKVTIDMSLPDILLVAGVTLDGEIVIMPKTLDSAQTLKTRLEELMSRFNKRQVRPLYFLKKKSVITLQLMYSAAAAVFSCNKSFLCPKNY
ncbi:LOW QUALITY PROTEIN: hypothetical protein HID58_055074 [Brassica napus]|uniref:F-box associated beta-propeller type 3 domain-containing protein n=1 Tax=Brassica napus TaxID=3708 RepID=A0ABQ8AKV3_BRANA|nr:LOW QUALITY PROTEIN: hypothetical protein HID58_055074 [Brassica napus]